MAYNQYTDGKPDPTTDNGLSAFDNTRKNLDALRDSLTIGVMPGWEFVPVEGTGSEEFPQYHQYTKGQERIRLELDWGTSGGAENNLIEMIAEYTDNHTSNPYDTIGTCTITYSVNGIVSGTTWA